MDGVSEGGVTERDSRSRPYIVIAVPMINPAAPW